MRTTNAVAAVLGLAMGAGMAGKAGAVVLYCRAPIMTEAADKAEATARRQALQRWQAEARGKLGAAWSSWRLASPKVVRCAPAEGGAHVCRALARPCALAQNPKRPPRAGGLDI
ncbi:MAG: hypothetical protein AB7O57_03010 [Hyphomicrobiaceae bacterium]